MDTQAAVEDAVSPAGATESVTRVHHDLAPGSSTFVGPSTAAAPPRAIPARLVEYAPGCRIALPVHATLEVLEPAPIVEVPGARDGWRGLLRWRGDWLPVVDLAGRLGVEGAAETGGHLLVLGWRPAPGQPFRYGALVLRSMPTTLRFGDDDQCSIPTDQALWAEIALSCVWHDGRAVPIVDPARLFGG